jgi:hypothetical protein
MMHCTRLTQYIRSTLDMAFASCLWIVKTEPQANTSYCTNTASRWLIMIHTHNSVIDSLKCCQSTSTFFLVTLVMSLMNHIWTQTLHSWPKTLVGITQSKRALPAVHYYCHSLSTGVHTLGALSWSPTGPTGSSTSISVSADCILMCNSVSE